MVDGSRVESYKIVVLGEGKYFATACFAANQWHLKAKTI